MAAAEATDPSSYPELIMAAIKSLVEEGNMDTSESAISDRIESQHLGMLPESHASLLAEHLACLTDSGELFLVDMINYVRSEAAPKRGRGRPPKPRGRPPKPKDPVAVAASEDSSAIPRPRGRPAKKKAAAAGAPAVVGGGVAKRGRGRPPKAKPGTADDA
ncbi:HMG-Y-related protein A-like [Zingiber officinale]|uniref:H15 domain-containing protein n=1 Tax=Zingiber officinale TaxID=94328 RepID=A0A8J5GPX0_ZINOF|nr:HMG-Y-related protein A-like [Zingiber officinale]KAG6507843.1 hypothetical protein ZIOFF_033196 [Zingiber officinale]